MSFSSLRVLYAPRLPDLSFGKNCAYYIRIFTVHIFLRSYIAMHRTVNYALILSYHVSGAVILPCDYLKHVSSTVFMSLVYRTANMFLNIK